MSRVELKNVKKSFGPVQVISGASLEIEHGEFVVFVGPSGCGKSTLLRMISGLENVSGGEIFIGNKLMNNVDASERGIAMVFQSYALYPHMSVRENIAFGLKMAKMKPADITKNVNEVAATLQLEDLLDRKPKALSGGQRQRVAIGRAIVRNPDVFLFDEPLSNLDADLRVQMRIELAALHKKLGSTMIYVTHDQTEAMTLADKIVVLNEGRIEQVGIPLDIYDDPDNIFVAGFIGSPKMNFFSGTVGEEKNGEASSLVLNAWPKLKISTDLISSPPASGTKVKVGIRPEHFKLNENGPFQCMVNFAEHLGDQSFIYCTTQNGFDLIISLSGNRKIKNGDSVKCAVEKSDLRFFGENGERLR